MLFALVNLMEPVMLGAAIPTLVAPARGQQMLQGMTSSGVLRPNLSRGGVPVAKTYGDLLACPMFGVRIRTRKARMQKGQ